MTVKKDGPAHRPWRADVRDAAHKRHRKTFKTKREAEAYEEDIKRRSRTSPGVDIGLADRTTVAMVYKQWIERVKVMGTDGRGPVKPKTLAHYEHSWAAHVEPRWGQAPLARINYEMVSEWVNIMPARDGGGVAGNRPRVEAASLLRRVLDHAVRLRYVDRNPALDPLGKMPRLPSSRRVSEHQPLTMPQLRALARNCGTWEPFVLLAGTSGLRWGELAALRGGDLTRGEHPELRVVRAWSEVDGRMYLSTPKTNAARTVPVLPSVAKLLPRVRDDATMFPARRGGPVRNKYFRNYVLRPAIKAAQEDDPTFPDIKFHDLRHTAVSIAISTGANLKAVQNLAGHSKATLTLDLYAGMFKKDMLNMVGAVEDLYLQEASGDDVWP